MNPVRVKQRDITDCGAACLASVAGWYGLKLPVARVRQMAGTDRRGTNILGLIEASEKMGFRARGVRGEWESLFKITLPAIAHVIIKGTLHHYVVITEASRKCICIMDPADGAIHSLSHDEFRKEWTGVLVLLTPGEKFSLADGRTTTGSRFWKLVRPHRKIILQSLAGALIYSILGLAMSLYVGKLVDYVLPGGNLNLLNLLGAGMIIIILLRLILSYYQSLFILKTGQNIDATLILGYYQHLLKLPVSFFDNMRTGEIISRIGDAVKIRMFVNDVLVNLILNIFILAVSFILMFTFFWKLAVIMLFVIPFYLIVYIISDRLNRKVQRLSMERSADLESQLVESLNSARTLKMFGLEEYSNLRTEARFVSLLEVLYRSGLNIIFSSGSASLLSQLITVIVLWTGAGFALDQELTPGELLSFYSVVGYFTGPVTTIIGFNRTLQDARIAADRLFEIFDLEVTDESGKIELRQDMLGPITFENVKFRYGTRVDVFEGLDLIINQGEITAITGESGSGKTTMILLLQNLYPLQSGRIRIGNYDLNHLSVGSLRRMISVVPQKVDLFAGTIMENIALGELEPDIPKVLSVCDQLGMTSFIEQLPGGYNTLVGENGVCLSGGQQQRIAIARALYRDPRILILDEATSSLDSNAEMFVKRTLELLKSKDITVILIAHRMSTISHAGRVIVLDKGKIVQDGSFEKLSSEEGSLRKIIQQQTFLLDEEMKIS